MKFYTYSKKPYRGKKAKKRGTSNASKLKKFISSWEKNVNCEAGGFYEFIGLIGIKKPVKLSAFNEDEESFKCVTADEKTLLITLKTGDSWGRKTEIHVTDSNETRCYFVYAWKTDNELIKKVSYYKRIVRKNGKELISDYYEQYCSHKLKFESFELKVIISEPYQGHRRLLDEELEVRVAQKREEVEEYLLGLDQSLSVEDVFRELMNMLAFSKEDINRSEKIIIEFTKDKDSRDQDERLLGKIELHNGKLKEYAVTENEVTYYASDNESWECILGDGISISYSKHDKGIYDISISGSENMEKIPDLRAMFKIAKRRIRKIKKNEFKHFLSIIG